MRILTLKPAYGVKASTSAEVQKLWEDGKDFIVETICRWTGSYCSIRDLEALRNDWTHVKLRYRGDTRLLLIKLGGE